MALVVFGEGAEPYEKLKTRECYCCGEVGKFIPQEISREIGIGGWTVKLSFYCSNCLAEYTVKRRNIRE